MEKTLSHNICYIIIVIIFKKMNKNSKSGLLENFVDATYILTITNSKRINSITHTKKKNETTERTKNTLYPNI